MAHEAMRKQARRARLPIFSARGRGGGRSARGPALRAPADVAHRAIALGEAGTARAGGAVAAAARRADQHAVAALEDVLLAVVPAAAVDAQVAATAGGAAGEAGGG